MNEQTYTIVESELTNGLIMWEATVDGYQITHGLTLEIALKNLLEWSEEIMMEAVA
jgi:hypothetical protein